MTNETKGDALTRLHAARFDNKAAKLIAELAKEISDFQKESRK